MLSILIPVYNYDATLLVNEILKQALLCNIEFEIRLYDDGSSEYLEKNKKLNKLDHCSVKALPKNIGRSAIRNLLASDAIYEHLLFIDSGTFPKRDNFIKKYLEQFDNFLVTGGMVCLPVKPKKPYTLRWMYTKKREMVKDQNPSKNVVCSSNFLIQKSLFDQVKFDETLKKYGCEDVVFFDAILKKGISIHHIDNPVIHDAQDDTTTFLRKTEHAIENLIYLTNTGKLGKDSYQVSSIYYKLKKIKLDKVIVLIFKLTKNLLILNFNSSYPSILGYDFYRLGYFCLINNKE